MEWKRTARNIAGSLRAFPVQNRLNRSIQISVGYSFARAIMEKYQLSEDEYGSLSASFVYLDGTLGQGGSECVRELVDALTVLYRLRVSVLNQSYERNYYVAVNMRCEQMFAALERSLSWQAETRELRSIWRMIMAERPGEKSRESGGRPGSQGGLEGRERLGGREGLESRKDSEDREGLEGRERPGSRGGLEGRERLEGREGLEGRKGSEARERLENREGLESRKNSEGWESQESRKDSENREGWESRKDSENREGQESRKDSENQEARGYRQESGNRQQGQRDEVEERLKILREQVQTRILENAGKAGALSLSFGGRAGEGAFRAGSGISGIRAGQRSLTAFAGFSKGGNEAGARASVLSAWKSPQARRFFWRIQRASWWEQQIVLEASGTGSLLELMNRLRPLEGEAWMRFFSRLREQAESCMEDWEFFSRLISKAIERKIPVPILSGSRSADGSGKVLSEEPFAEGGRLAEKTSIPERLTKEGVLSAGEDAAEGKPAQDTAWSREETTGAEGTESAESRREPMSLVRVNELVPLARLKELMGLLIHQGEVWGNVQSQREPFAAGMQQESQEEMFWSLLEQGRILELLGSREEEDWLEQAKEAVFGLNREEWQTFKGELLRESGLATAEAGHPDRGSLAFGWFFGQREGADAEKERLLETAFRVQRVFLESEGRQQGGEIRDAHAGDRQGGEIQDIHAGNRQGRKIRDAHAGNWQGREIRDAHAGNWQGREIRDVHAGNRQGREIRDTYVGNQQERKIQDIHAGEQLQKEIRWLRNRLTGEPSVSGRLAGLLNEGLRRLRREEELESGYRAVTEAVSYLGEQQWEQLKKEFFLAEQREDEAFPGTVLHWLWKERQIEEGEAGKDEEYSVRDGMAGEKRSFLKALMAEAENRAIPVGQKEQTFRRIFVKSRVLSEYIDWNESAFQSGTGLRGSDTFRTPDLEGQELSATLSSLTEERWERLIRELPVMEGKRLLMENGDREAVRGLWELFRNFPENEGREAELSLQKQSVLRFLNQSRSEGGGLGKLLEEELRGLEVSEKRRNLYQSLSEAASYMNREEWKTFQREVAEALGDETGKKGAAEFEALNRKYLAGPKERDATESGEQGRKWPAGPEERSTEEPGELMEMSEEKREFLRALAGRLFHVREDGAVTRFPGLEEAGGPEAGKESSPEEEYGYWERVFRKSEVLSRYVSWEEAEARAGKREIDLVEEEIRRLDAKRWQEFKGGMEKRLLRTLFPGGEAREKFLSGISGREAGEKFLSGIFEQEAGEEFLSGVSEQKAGEEFWPGIFRRKERPEFLSGIPGQETGPEFLYDISEREFGPVGSGQEVSVSSGTLTLKRGWRHAARSAAAGSVRTGNFRERTEGFREFADQLQEAVEEMFSVSSSLPLSAGEMSGRLSFPGGHWDFGTERGTAAAVRLLENLRLSRVTASLENLGQSQAADNPENLGQSQVTAEEAEPEVRAYDTAALVVAQSGAARDNRRLPPETVRPEIKSEVTRQVQEQTADIRFISRSQATRQEMTAESQTELKSLIRQVEQQQRELKELQKKQETAVQKAELPQISRSVMKQLRGQLQMEGLRHGR